MFIQCRQHACVLSHFNSVQSLSRVRLFMTPWIGARQASLHHQLPEFTQTHVHQVNDAIQPSHPLSSPSSPSAPNPSQHQSFFQWVNSSHQEAKVLEFQLQHHPFQESPGLISFRMDWLALLAVQRTLKNLLQHHSSKASILWSSAFFMVQLISIYDYQKNHSFDWMDLCWQSDVFAFW